MFLWGIGENAIQAITERREKQSFWTGDISNNISNKSLWIRIIHKDINLIDYNKLKADCYILNTPFWKDTIFKNLIDKIFLGNVSNKKKYYIVIINVDVILKKEI